MVRWRTDFAARVIQHEAKNLSILVSNLQIYCFRRHSRSGAPFYRLADSLRFGVLIIEEEANFDQVREPVKKPTTDLSGVWLRPSTFSI